MTKVRKVTETARGMETTDGAGVRLVRVIGNWNQDKFDPFLMLDSFDSHNPDDYIAGFPMHPHRGIETITYLIEGEIEHQDSLGNKGTIHGGESQWMNSGSGIIHQEMPAPTERMLGVQIWLNLTEKDKMSEPTYFDITNQMMGQKVEHFGKVHVIAGNYKDSAGVNPPHQPVALYDIEIEAGKEAVIPTDAEDNVFIFNIQGDIEIAGWRYHEKTAVVFGKGDEIRVQAADGKPARVIFFAGKKLKEPVAWGGPIVMNTEAEVMTAFEELQSGSFIKEK
jgi:redox-sensitive bicupin YhaK (pirin superfamily)